MEILEITDAMRMRSCEPIVATNTMLDIKVVRPLLVQHPTGSTMQPFSIWAPWLGASSALAERTLHVYSALWKSSTALQSLCQS